MTYAPWIEIDCSGVVIKAQDLLTPSGKTTNKYFDLIKNAGGIHEFLGFDGEVLLSSIMPDKMIYGFSIEAHVDMIDTLQPDYYYTPDGETYLTEEWLSQLEINRIFSGSELLFSSFPHIKPIGLVKGCTHQMIDDHTNRLLSSGVSHFVFHAGDYLCQGSSLVVGQAINFANLIHRKVPWLAINGVGAMSTLKNFSFADGFVTQSHYVNAFYGKFCDASRKDDGEKRVSRADIMNNLRNIQRNISAIQLQKCLSDWIIIDGTKGYDFQNRVLYNSNDLTGIKGGN
jgi:hypothetical protein